MSLGSGAGGIVYHGEVRDQNVAIKKIEFTNKEETNIKLYKELIIMNELDHPNLIKLLYWTSDSSHLYIITKYVENKDLLRVLNATKLNKVQKFSIIKQLASAINYLHNVNPQIIHGDIKSLNILLDNNCIAYLIDYGMSKQLTSSYINRETIKQGTEFWMAPEIWEGTPYNEKSDVYSFGILIWEILTQNVPYCDHPKFKDLITGKAIIMNDIRNGMRPTLKDLDSDVPEALINLMKLCWNADKHLRPKFTTILEELNRIEYK